MPHSSGGGGSRGVHAGSGGGHNANVGYRPFAGSVHYVYYRENGEPQDLYAKADMENMKKPNAALHGIGLAILLGVAIWCLVLFVQQFTFPHRIDPASYSSAIVIEDRTGAVDEDALRGVFSDFRELTGVTPSVEILYESDPQLYSPKAYARNEYMRLFDDEKHWLFVILFPDDESVCSCWEGMIGDNTGGVIGAASERSFTYILQRKLSAAKPADLNGALAEAFAEFSAGVMRPHTDGANWGLFLIMFLILLCYAERQVRSYRMDCMLYMAKKVPEGKEKKACLKCGCGYYPGTVRRCPRCGERTEKK